MLSTSGSDDLYIRCSMSYFSKHESAKRLKPEVDGGSQKVRMPHLPKALKRMLSESTTEARNQGKVNRLAKE